MDQINTEVNLRIATLGAQYVDGIQASYKNYKRSPLGKKAVIAAKSIMDIKHNNVFKLDGKVVTRSNKIYNELLNGGDKFTRVYEKYLRAEVLKNGKLYIQTLKRSNGKYEVYKEFEKEDTLPAYMFRPFEGNPDSIENQTSGVEEFPKKLDKYRHYKQPVIRKDRRMKAGAIDETDMENTLNISEVDGLMYDR